MAPLLPQLLVFDLDGTLIDSRVDLCNSVNATLEHFKKQTLPDSVIAGYIGDGAPTLVRRALAHAHAIRDQPDPHDDAFVAAALDWFLGYYRIHKLDFTYLYPGVLESLSAIRAAHPGLPLAVLTNKPVRPSRDICAHFGLDRFFFQNYGGNSFTTKKPDPEGLLKLIAEANVTPEVTVMIGDSGVDIETARNAGTRSLGCTFGLAPEALAAANPDATVDSAWEWPQALGPSSESVCGIPAAASQAAQNAFRSEERTPGARAFLPLLGIPREACGGVFIKENAHQGRSPALHQWEKCSKAVLQKATLMARLKPCP